MAFHKKGEIENICIYGIGGVGGYFGGKIACQLSQSRDKKRTVSFIARGKHLEEIRKNGLTLNTSENERLLCRPTVAADNMEEIPKPDLCLLCVKGYDLVDAAKEINKQIREDTMIIPLLNGVDIHERVRANMSRGIVFPSCLYVSAQIEKPGTVTQKGKNGIILCGRDSAIPDFNQEQLIDFFGQVGIDFKWVDNPFPAIWGKYVFIAPFGLVTACFDRTLGQVQEEKELKELTIKIMEEVVLLAKAKEIELPEDIVRNSLEMAKNFPYETTTSFQRDIKAGKKSEGDLFGGTIIRMAKETGVAAPVTETIYSKILEKLEASN